MRRLCVGFRFCLTSCPIDQTYSLIYESKALYKLMSRNIAFIVMYAFYFVYKLEIVDFKDESFV